MGLFHKYVPYDEESAPAFDKLRQLAQAEVEAAALRLAKDGANSTKRLRMSLFKRNDIVVRIATGKPPMQVIGHDSVGRVLCGYFEGSVRVREDIPEDQLCLEADWLGAQPAPAAPAEPVEPLPAPEPPEPPKPVEDVPAEPAVPEKRHAEAKPLSTAAPEPKVKKPKKAKEAKTFSDNKKPYRWAR